MPRRKRGQEFKRRLRKAMAAVEAEVVLTAAQADPMSDYFWVTPHDPDDDCYFVCTHYPPEEAMQEIQDYLNRPRNDATREGSSRSPCHASGVTRHA